MGGNVFCDGDHLSDKCRIVLDVQARKDLLRKKDRCFMCLKTDFISRNSQKTKPCFYRKKYVTLPSELKKLPLKTVKFQQIML